MSRKPSRLSQALAANKSHQSLEIMDLTSQKLVHSFGALADLGQEIANPNELNDMVRTSLHLLLVRLPFAGAPSRSASRERMRQSACACGLR